MDFTDSVPIVTDTILAVLLPLSRGLVYHCIYGELPLQCHTNMNRDHKNLFILTIRKLLYQRAICMTEHVRRIIFLLLGFDAC